MSLEIWSFVVDVLSLIATVVLTVAIYWLQRSHEKEREQMEVEAQKKAVAEAARVFLIDNEDEIEYLPLSAIAKSLNLKRKHHRAITTKFLRCSEEVQKEILKQANFQLIEVSKEEYIVLGCLMSIYRIRCNMMHGLKIVKQLDNQYELFKAVNGVLESIR